MNIIFILGAITQKAVTGWGTVNIATCNIVENSFIIAASSKV